MRLLSENRPEILDVTETQMDRILRDEEFGNFVILSASDDDFIQAACNWSASNGVAAFIKRTGSDPYRLEYRDGASKTLYAARGDVTLTQVKEAFISYLRGEAGWRRQFE